MLRNEYKEFECKEVEDVIKRICVECGESHDINEMSLYSDGFRCKRCSIEKEFYDSLTDEEFAEIFGREEDYVEEEFPYKDIYEW